MFLVLKTTSGVGDSKGLPWLLTLLDKLFSWSFNDSFISSLLLNPCNDPLKKVLLLPFYRVWDLAELVRVTPLGLEPTEVWLQGWMKTERCDYGRFAFTFAITGLPFSTPSTTLP